jgi:hypothetical protein
MNPCTCGTPGYPVIDLTPAMVRFLGSSITSEIETVTHLQCWDDSAITKLGQDVYEACKRFGCFHVQLRNHCPTCSKPLYCSGPLQHYDRVVQNIHHLFEEGFLQGIHEPVSYVPFHRRTNAKDSGCISSQACFRGRGTESGSVSNASNSNPTFGDAGHVLEFHPSTLLCTSQHCLEEQLYKQTEPKQSWELHRCVHGWNCNPCPETHRTQNDFEESHRLQIIHDYIQILHAVAACILSPIVLNLPANTFIQENPCSCSGSFSTNICCMDLLRIFKYDAVSSVQEQRRNLGSNPHTDWGSLTVIWQDQNGGLENYCYSHQRWNTVDVLVDEPDHTHLFVHVGDFLSLAMNHSNHESCIRWPSPRHQVLCPLASKSAESSIPSARYSLVYFVYPPMGVSLQDAEERIHSNMENGNYLQVREEQEPDIFPYDRYFLLLDQSSSNHKNQPKRQSHSETDHAKNQWERIRTTPFHLVIQEKWSQVQRG